MKVLSTGAYCIFLDLQTAVNPGAIKSVIISGYELGNSLFKLLNAHTSCFEWGS